MYTQDFNYNFNFVYLKVFEGKNLMKMKYVIITKNK